MRIVKILIALPMILLFGILRLLATAISWLYCRAASLLFIPMIILLILSVIATQWHDIISGNIRRRISLRTLRSWTAGIIIQSGVL